MQSADTDTTQHAEPAGQRLTWLRTSCFCLTVGTTRRRGRKGGRKGGKSEGGRSGKKRRWSGGRADCRRTCNHSLKGHLKKSRRKFWPHTQIKAVQSFNEELPAWSHFSSNTHKTNQIITWWLDVKWLTDTPKVNWAIVKAQQQPVALTLNNIKKGKCVLASRNTTRQEWKWPWNQPVLSLCRCDCQIIDLIRLFHNQTSYNIHAQNI